MGHVATARYLMLPQLKKIVFVRSLNGKRRRSERQRGGGVGRAVDSDGPEAAAFCVAH